MPNDHLSQAIKEAYASVPSDEIIHDTLELYHPAFVDESENPVSWTPSETQTCGNLLVGETCELKFDNFTNKYFISEDETSGNYSFKVWDIGIFLN